MKEGPARGRSRSVQIAVLEGGAAAAFAGRKWAVWSVAAWMGLGKSQPNRGRREPSPADGQFRNRCKWSNLEVVDRRAVSGVPRHHGLPEPALHVPPSFDAFGSNGRRGMLRRVDSDGAGVSGRGR